MRPLDPFGISAWSWLNALGSRDHARASWNLEGSGLTPHDESLGLPGQWGQIKRPLTPLPKELARHRSRCAELLVAALEPMRKSVDAVVARYGAQRVGVVLGSSTGGIDATEHALAVQRRTGKMPDDFIFEEAHVYHALIRLIQNLHGILGPGYVISTACSSAGKAIGASQRLLSAGNVDAVLTGGVDALCEMTLRGFGGLGILSPTGCRPFDGARNGISIGEGAALLLLERDTSSPYSILGVGESSDAHHVTAPHPQGLGARLAMERALCLAELTPADVDYINGHGTGTRQNDSTEAQAISEIFGPRACFSSTKDRVGHQLGTAGATEALFCLQALENQRIPLNRPLDETDRELPVQPRLENEHPASPLVNVLSNSFAFGGSNCTVALGVRKNARGEARKDLRLAGRPYVKNISLWGEGFPDVESFLEERREAECRIPAAKVLKARPRGRASVLTRLFAELYGQLRGPREAAASFDESSIATAYGSAYGEMGTTVRLLDQLAEDLTLSPARFQGSVHNTAGGQLSIATGNRAFSTAIAAGASTVAMTLLDAATWLSLQGGEALVLVADEEGPARMLRGNTFPALGVGLHLCWSESPPEGALGWLGEVHQTERRSVPVGAGPFTDSPAAWGLELVKTLAHRASAEVIVGHRWVLDVHGL